MCFSEMVLRCLLARDRERASGKLYMNEKMRSSSSGGSRSSGQGGGFLGVRFRIVNHGPIMLVAFQQQAEFGPSHRIGNPRG